MTIGLRAAKGPQGWKSDAPMSEGSWRSATGAKIRLLQCGDAVSGPYTAKPSERDVPRASGCSSERSRARLSADHPHAAAVEPILRVPCSGAACSIQAEVRLPIQPGGGFLLYKTRAHYMATTTMYGVPSVIGSMIEGSRPNPRCHRSSGAPVGSWRCVPAVWRPF